MPTADDYWAWQGWFEDMAMQAASSIGPALEDAGPQALQGGQLAVTVDVTIRASVANASEVAAKLFAHAEECANRAIACDNYAAEMAAYDTLLNRHRVAMDEYLTAVDAGASLPMPRPPNRPEPPASWIELPGG